MVIVVVVGIEGARAEGGNWNSKLYMRKRKHDNGEGNVKTFQNHSHTTYYDKRLKAKLNELDVTSVATKEVAEALIFRDYI